jgi:hypothetical protein
MAHTFQNRAVVFGLLLLSLLRLSSSSSAAVDIVEHQHGHNRRLEDIDSVTLDAGFEADVVLGENNSTANVDGVQHSTTPRRRHHRRRRRLGLSRTFNDCALPVDNTAAQFCPGTLYVGTCGFLSKVRDNSALWCYHATQQDNVCCVNGDNEKCCERDPSRIVLVNLIVILGVAVISLFLCTVIVTCPLYKKCCCSRMVARKDYYYANKRNPAPAAAGSTVTGMGTESRALVTVPPPEASGARAPLTKSTSRVKLAPPTEDSERTVDPSNSAASGMAVIEAKTEDWDEDM